jgi:hypothetical protein
MTRDDIIRMAQEAGWEMNDLSDGFGVRLMRFTELVYMNGYDLGIEAGCDSCAYLLERLHERQGPEPVHNYFLFAANAIRERGKS